MIKAAIFDVDGVLVDSEPLASLAYEMVFKLYGITLKKNQRGLVFEAAVREKDVFEKLKKEYNVDESIEVLMQKRNELYSEILKDLVPRPGVEKILQTLQAHNIVIGIASSGISERVQRKMQIINVLNYFQHITGGEHVTRGKPFPDIFLECAKQLKVRPEDCVVFEDSENGVKAAKAARMKVIAIPTEYTRAHDFSTADMLANSLESITWKMISAL